MVNVDLLVLNATVVTMDKERRILTNAGIAVKADKIIAIAGTDSLKATYTSKKVLDGTNRFLFPGLINTHNHFFQVLLKGLGKDLKLMDWLEASIQKAFARISHEDIWLATVMGCIEQLKSGVTTVLDYQYANGKPRLNDEVIKAFEATGIRGILGRGYGDNSTLPEGLKCEYTETEADFFAEVRRLSAAYKDSSTIDIALAPGIIWSLSEDGFRECVALAKELGTFITMHTIETEEDNAFSLGKYGMPTIAFLEKVGVLSVPFLAVHCAQITKDEIGVLGKHKVRVSYNAISNMMMGYQTLPVVDLLEEGISVGLATDGAASNDNQNMLEVLRISPLWQKAFYRDPSVLPATKILEMATIDGADAVFKKDSIGSLEIGKKADFFIFNPMHCNTVPVVDPVVCLVYGAGENNIETTVVDGKIVLENGKILGVDENEIIMRLQKAAFDLRQRAGISNVQWNQRIDCEPFREN